MCLCVALTLRARVVLDVNAACVRVRGRCW